MTAIMMNNSSIICPFVNEKFFEAGVIKWEKWDMGSDGLRILLSGPSGSGKTTLAQSILSKTALHLPQCQIYVLDYKNIDFSYLYGAKHFYSYDKTTDGFLEFYNVFEKRLETNDDYNSLTPLVLYIDEYPSWVISFASKEQKEILSKMARLLNLSRAKKIHIIVSAQKPLNELFAFGARESFSHKVLLQAPSKETVNMLMPAYKDEISACQTGVGYCTVNDANLTKIRVPFPRNKEAMRKDLLKAVNR